MSEEKERWLRQRLEKGVEVKHIPPYYMNAVVGEGYVGYVIALTDDNNKQVNVVLKVRNNRELFDNNPIIMTVHSVFYYENSGKEKRIEASVIGREVTLNSNASSAISPHYYITGIFTLKEKVP